MHNLLDRGFRNIRCFARASSGGSTRLKTLFAPSHPEQHIDVISGNLLSPEDCYNATRDVSVIFHLAAGRGEKSFPDAFMNSVVTTRNLLEASIQGTSLKRFVNVSSLAAYTNTKKPHWRTLDESCPVETRAAHRGDAYSFAKLKQDELVAEYARQFGIPLVVVRPGVVYGAGNEGIHPRVGLDTFGVFLHLGGSNRLPLTYVDNCADAIVFIGLKAGIDGEVFNIVDDSLPTSRQFLRQYKHHVSRFPSLYVPHILSYALSFLWERYSAWSQGQLPPAFTRSRWHANWKKTTYSNAKLKALGWRPKVPTPEGLRIYFEACRNRGQNA